jgi:hypothetical protein
MKRLIGRWEYNGGVYQLVIDSCAMGNVAQNDINPGVWEYSFNFNLVRGEENSLTESKGKVVEILKADKRFVNLVIV